MLSRFALRPVSTLRDCLLGIVKDCHPVLVAKVQVRPTTQQMIAHLGTAVNHAAHERRAAIMIGPIDLCAPQEQDVDHFRGLSKATSGSESSVSTHVALSCKSVHWRASSQQLTDARRIALVRSDAKGDDV